MSIHSTSSNEPGAARREVEVGERLYPHVDSDTLAEWASEVHEFLDDAEQPRSASGQLSASNQQPDDKTKEGQ
jgi:hypothetical protein